MRPDPIKGETLDVNLVGADKGDVWTGFEWVKPERYEQLRAGPMPNLPPIQPLPGECGTCQQPIRDDVMTGTACACSTRSGKGGDGTGYAYQVDYSAVEARALAHMLRDPEHVVQALLSTVIGEDVTRGGLLETPARVAKAWKHWTSGYSKDPAELLKVFEDGAEGVNEMVVVRDIPIYSHCEHHLAPIFGTATIGYLPDGKIVGLSKLNRLADMFARRLQVQERMTNQIADALMQHLAPHGCGVVVNARHMCMESRGVQQSSSTTTSALRGVFKDDPTVRAEFLSLARGGVA